MTEKAERAPLDELVGINLEVPKREHRVFKVWCIEHEITQVDAFRKRFQFFRVKKGEAR
ncbi:hypothetical protein [Novispirillum itersonii]|uniref:hypothetical protein n=1 Tax=Novispirillum itersonii TaxID=189 RepID=UPI00036D8DE3|nr:hypothetical protein [Novispirillum itersonii]